jgi:hypothetical protein
MVNDDELTELRSVNKTIAQLSQQILTEPANPKRKEQVKELGRFKINPGGLAYALRHPPSRRDPVTGTACV